MGSLREDLETAYKTAYELARTDTEREKVRSVFRDLFVSAKKKRIRIPAPDPFGILAKVSQGTPVEIFDPIRKDRKPEARGERLCDKLDDDEMTDFARTVCGDRASDRCIREVHRLAIERKDGKSDDAGFNRGMIRTLKHYGVVPTGDYATMLKMRSPCMVEEILKICNYDPECLDRFQKPKK
jgi:hypothetical protein